MAKLSEVYASNEEDAENGKWLTLRPASGDSKPLEVKIRSAHSRKVRKEEQKLDKKYRVQYMAGNGVLDPSSQDERDVELVAKAILVDWKNFDADDGTSLVFGHKVVSETLAAFPQLRREILFMARMDDNFRPERTEAEREAVVGN